MRETGFHALDNAVAIVLELRPVLDVIVTHNPKLADEARRAAESVVNNLREGRRRFGKDRVHAFRIASGSNDEIRGALDSAEAWGYVTPNASLLEKLDRESAMLWKLSRPRD
ncbi:MAG TPA: four helix bundle protein [Planctomycetota bacterium]|nr:four helix bundle protein [Planctomycetota bacterium]